MNPVVLLSISILLSVAVGWIANIVQIVHVINDPITGMFILKCFGVVLVPLGVVLGYIGMF